MKEGWWWFGGRVVRGIDSRGGSQGNMWLKDEGRGSGRREGGGRVRGRKGKGAARVLIKVLANPCVPCLLR